MSGKIVMCPKCGKNFEDIYGLSEQFGEKPLCPECKARANGKFRRIISQIAEKAIAAGKAIAETYREIGTELIHQSSGLGNAAREIGRELIQKSKSLGKSAANIYRSRQKRKAQKKAEALRLKEEAKVRKALLRRGIILTAAQSLACQIKKNLGYVSANLYVELKDQSAEAITARINAKEAELLDELRLKAHKLGANAVVGLNVSKTMSLSHLSHSRLMSRSLSAHSVTGVLLSAYGTALEIVTRPKTQAH